MSFYRDMLNGSKIKLLADNYKGNNEYNIFGYQIKILVFSRIGNPPDERWVWCNSLQSDHFVEIHIYLYRNKSGN